VRAGAALCLSAAIALFTWSQAARRAATAARLPSAGEGLSAVDRGPVQVGRAA
jgi:hypothetical protein